MENTVEGRAYLYNFDFPKFDEMQEETIAISAPFVWQGLCWKFRFPGSIRVYSDDCGLPILFMSTDVHANSMPLCNPIQFEAGDEINVVVRSQHRHWFRRNRARVTFEGVEGRIVPVHA